ncbi:ADP-heptose:LPS heptosyltransferase [Actinokineospora iranica]|uniref:ADP-heptose:LPS heptosyltransferase n=1 Tax=Actinokineospora iranica TaxID=1271860 RepID=A0A1G6WNF2_9PSEU|nr:ADP-heptose:LPS heptosyltransferase [Actinokineospora iranica]
MILVLRALKLGDLLVAVPALRAIRAHWPDQDIVLATSGWLAPLVELIGAVDRVLPVKGLEPLDVERPDVTVNLHGAGPESDEILDALGAPRRVGYGRSGPHWEDGFHERVRMCRLLIAHGIPADPDDLRLARPAIPSPAPGAVLVHPGAAYGSKIWPAERFAAVIAELSGPVVVTGSAIERGLAERVVALAGLAPEAVLAGRTSLLELAALVAHAALVVCGDTGTAHLAYAFGTPSVVLFGPVGPEIWGPPPGPHISLSAEGLRRGDPFADDPDPALLGVGVGDVLTAARTLRPERVTGGPPSSRSARPAAPARSRTRAR